MEPAFLSASRDLLNTQRAAQYLGVGESTMRSWRATGKFGGPAYFTFNKRIYYDVADLDTWVDACRHTGHQFDQNAVTNTDHPDLVDEAGSRSLEDLDFEIKRLEWERSEIDAKTIHLCGVRDALLAQGGQR